MNLTFNSHSIGNFSPDVVRGPSFDLLLYFLYLRRPVLNHIGDKLLPVYY